MRPCGREESERYPVSRPAAALAATPLRRRSSIFDWHCRAPFSRRGVPHVVRLGERPVWRLRPRAASGVTFARCRAALAVRLPLKEFWMSVSTWLLGPRFDSALAESQWEAVLAKDPSATTATATWPAVVDSQIARQLDLSSYVSRSLGRSLVLAILATLLFPAVGALLYEPVRRGRSPSAPAMCSRRRGRGSRVCASRGRGRNCKSHRRAPNQRGGAWPQLTICGSERSWPRTQRSFACLP